MKHVKRLADDRRDGEVGQTAFAVTAGNLVTIAALEQLLPRKVDAGFFRDSQALHDLAHGTLMSLLGAPMGRALGTALVIGAAALAGGETATGIWPYCSTTS